MINLLQILKDRLKQPSTWRGLGILAGAIGYKLTPQFIDSITALVIAFLGFIEVARNEFKKN